MSIFEYDQEKHFRQIAEENMAEGWEKGRQAGREEGIAIGKAEGKAEGRAEGKRLATLENIRSLMDSLGTPAEQAMAVLKIPAEEQKTYAEQLKEYSEMN